MLDVALRDLDAPILVRVATLFRLFPYTSYALNAPEVGGEVQVTRQRVESGVLDVLEGSGGDRWWVRLAFERALFDYLRMLVDGGYLELSFRLFSPTLTFQPYSPGLPPSPPGRHSFKAAVLRMALHCPKTGL